MLLIFALLTTVNRHADLGLSMAFFPHALYEGNLVRIIVAGGVIWFLIMITVVLAEYASRDWLALHGK